jgi:hypothetical protein
MITNTSPENDRKAGRHAMKSMGTVWSYLDMTALGRQEIWEDSPKGYPQERRISGGTGAIAKSPTRRLIRGG